MDKKFIAAVIVCFLALTTVATGTYFLGQKSDENKVNLKSAGNTETVTDEKNVEAAQNNVNETESVTPGDRIGMADEYKDDQANETQAVGAGNVVEENTVSNAKGDDYMYGLSSEAAAQIRGLKFDAKSELLWPVQGSIIMPYDMKNTVYFSTLDEYKCNPALVIQSSKGAAIKAAADGVITFIDEDEELGVYINEAIGSDYIATYGQIVNPEVKAGDFVEAGQTIAYVNTPTKYYTKEGDNLYFSLEKNGKSVDPLKFIDYED